MQRKIPKRKGENMRFATSNQRVFFFSFFFSIFTLFGLFWLQFFCNFDYEGNLVWNCKHFDLRKLLYQEALHCCGSNYRLRRGTIVSQFLHITVLCSRFVSFLILKYVELPQKQFKITLDSQQGYMRRHQACVASKTFNEFAK